MGTKENPGEFDCYAAAMPDEPIFILKSTDATAPIVVRMWADLNRHLKEAAGTYDAKADRKHQEAYKTAYMMELYRKKHGS